MNEEILRRIETLEEIVRGLAATVARHTHPPVYVPPPTYGPLPHPNLDIVSRMFQEELDRMKIPERTEKLVEVPFSEHDGLAG